MATKKSSKYDRKYYEKHKKEIIAKEAAKHKANRPKYAKEMKEYYHENEDYRKYKRAYAKKYRKEEPIKSRARKDRKTK